MSLTRTLSVSSSTPRQRLKRHTQYSSYINGGNLHLLVRGVKFRVHSNIFEGGSTKFLPDQTNGHRGDSDESPIIVDVDPAKFEKLLWVFYTPKYSMYDASIEDWSDILDLSHEWGFTEVKNHAIRELQKHHIPTAERIALYLKYSVGCEFLVPLYAELCSSSEMLTLEEATLIGLPVVIIIFKVREELRVRTPLSPPPPPPPASPLPVGITEDDVRAQVVIAFGFPPEVANQEPAPCSAPNPRPNLNSNGRTVPVGGRGTWKHR
ncbi:hypothetical protein F5887DRAFT_428739 [Amanita rubescens]|nr:hypothetical protein F5887DRAFT_428739 [Amanita rubescens]